MTSRTNSTTSQTTTYAWDEDNRLTLVTLPSTATVAYTYDVRGRMLTRTDSTGTTRFVWAGMACVEETDASGNVTRYDMPDGVLRSFDRNGTVYQVFGDALGSVRLVTDTSGTVKASYQYDSYGNQLPSTSDSIPNGGLQYRFVGAFGVRWDAGTGLYYMRARWYDPTLQRFLSRDPVRSIHRYMYAANSPSNYIDPSGLICLPSLAGNDAISDKDLQQAYNDALGKLTGQPLATYNNVNNLKPDVSLLGINIGPNTASGTAIPGVLGSTNYTKGIGGNIDIDLVAAQGQSAASGASLSTVLASVLYHELTHVQQDIDTPNMSMADKEYNAYQAEYQYDMSIGYKGSQAFQLLAGTGYTDLQGHKYTGNDALKKFIDDCYVHPENCSLRKKKQGGSNCPC
jgi:RHS repeat-associated protein